MTRVVSIISNTLFCLIIVSILFSVGCQQFMDRAWGWIMVNGSSMVPSMDRGDYIFVVPYFASESNQLKIGDIIAFDDASGNHVVHRIIDNTDTGYITKGDGNSYSDQESSQPPITSGKIHGTVFKLGNSVFRIPVIGSLTLVLVAPGARAPLFFGILTLVIALFLIYLFRWQKERLPRVSPRLTAMGITSAHSGWQMILKYGIVTILGAAILMSALVKMSSNLDFTYGVSERGGSVLATSGGISLGIIPVGTEQRSKISIHGTFPIPVLAVFLSEDSGIRFSEKSISVPSGQEVQTEVVVDASADRIGIHNGPVTLLLFPQILPSNMVVWLAHQHELYAMFVISTTLMMVLTIPFGLIDYLLSRKKRSHQKAEILKYRRQNGLLLAMRKL